MTRWGLIVAQTADQLRIPKGDLTGGSFRNGIRLAFAIAGAIAVALIAYAGVKYVISQGNPQETAKAKNTIIDVLVGLVVIIFSYAIINFVMSNLL